MVFVLVSLVLIVCFSPLGPTDTLRLPLLMLSLTPGSILIVRLNLNPMFSSPSPPGRKAFRYP